MAEFLLGLGCLTMVVAYMMRESEHKEELRESFEKGYKRGLYENIVKFSDKAD